MLKYFVSHTAMGRGRALILTELAPGKSEDFRPGKGLR